MELIIKHVPIAKINIERFNLLYIKFIEKEKTSSHFKYCDAVCTIDDNDLNLYIIDSLLNKNLINIIIFFDECNYCDIYYPSINSMVIIDKKINFNIDFDFYHIEENIIYSRKMKLNNILNK